MEEQKQKKLIKTIYISASLIAIFVLTMVIFYPKYKEIKNSNQEAFFGMSPAGSNSNAKSPYHGFMMLTLKKNNDATSVPNVAILDLDKANIRFFNNEGAINITPDGLPGKFVGVVSSLPAVLDAKNQNIFQLYTVDMKNNFERKQLTKSDTLFKRNPKWAPNGEKIAFMARMGGDALGASQDPDSWNIYSTDLNGNEKMIGTGAYPQWSPDSKNILAMKSDGFYLYNYETGNSQKVLAMDSKMFLTNSVALSLDGSMLAINRPDKKSVSLMKISSWEPFKADIFRTLGDVSGSYPVFSPDMKNLAMILIDKK